MNTTIGLVTEVQLCMPPWLLCSACGFVGNRACHGVHVSNISIEIATATSTVARQAASSSVSNTIVWYRLCLHIREKSAKKKKHHN